MLYYAPLFIIRGLTGPSRRVAQKKRDSFMEGWKQAVDYAEKAEADGYWPVHANGKRNKDGDRRFVLLRATKSDV